MAKRLVMLTLALLLSATLSPSAFASVIFADDFTDGDANGWTFIPGFTQASSVGFGVVGNVMQLTQSSGDGFLGIQYSGGLSLPNSYQVTMDVRVVQDGGRGDRFHVFTNLTTYASQHFLAGWRQDGGSNDYFLTGIVGGSGLGHMIAGLSFDENQWHTVTIAKAGTNVQVAVNGIVGLNLTLPDITGGTIGFQTGLGSPASVMEVDNIVVTSDVIPEPASVVLLLAGGAALIFRRRAARNS